MTIEEHIAMLRKAIAESRKLCDAWYAERGL